jgi:hypothetical protein
MRLSTSSSLHTQASPNALRPSAFCATRAWRRIDGFEEVPEAGFSQLVPPGGGRRASHRNSCIRKLFFSEISCRYTISLHGHIFPTTGHLLVICFLTPLAYFLFLQSCMYTMKVKRSQSLFVLIFVIVALIQVQNNARSDHISSSPERKELHVGVSEGVSLDIHPRYSIFWIDSLATPIDVTVQ